MVSTRRDRLAVYEGETFETMLVDMIALFKSEGLTLPQLLIQLGELWPNVVEAAQVEDFTQDGDHGD